jgi:hypothetical protein
MIGCRIRQRSVPAKATIPRFEIRPLPFSKITGPTLRNASELPTTSMVLAADFALTWESECFRVKVEPPPIGSRGQDCGAEKWDALTKLLI